MVRSEVVHDVVTRFLCTDSSYVIYMESGDRLDVARVKNWTPEGGEVQFLWVYAVQGYFVLRQRWGADWELLRRVLPDPDQGTSFFESSLDAFPEWVEGWKLL